MRGRVRVDARTRKLATRLEAGDIAVIDHTDLDRSTAQLLIQARPSAVLNAAPSSSGRYPNLGPRLLLEAGIPLLDDLGSDIMTLREGAEVTVDADRVLQKGQTVATGKRATTADVEATIEKARQGLSSQVRAFTATTGEYLEREADLLLGSAGLPQLATNLEGKALLVILDDSDTKAQLRSIREWIRDTHPLVIAVEGGVLRAKEAKLSPTVIVGDMELVPEKFLRSNAELVLCQGLDGNAPGRERLNKMGVDYQVIESSGTAVDGALLLAARSEASVIVTVGDRLTLEDFFDRGRTGMSATFFTHLRAGNRLVSAQAVAAIHRPRIRRTSIFFLILAAIIALGGALFTTPFGQDLVTLGSDWITNLFTTAGNVTGASVH